MPKIKTIILLYREETDGSKKYFRSTNVPVHPNEVWHTIASAISMNHNFDIKKQRKNASRGRK